MKSKPALVSVVSALLLLGHPILHAADAPQPTLQDYIESMQDSVTPGDTTVAGKPTTTTSPDGLTDNTSTPMTVTRSVFDLGALNPNAGILFPGSLIQGASLQNGTLSAITVPRANLKVVLSPLGFDAGNTPPVMSETVKAPIDDGSVEAARVKLLAQKFNPVAKRSFTMNTFHSVDEAMMDVGMKANYLGAKLSGSLDTSSFQSKTNLLVCFSQEYYTLAVVPPSSPTSYFGPHVKVSDLTFYSDPKTNPITYVTSVTYGRMGLLFVSSEEDISTLKDAVNAEVSFVNGSASASLNAQQAHTLQQSECQALFFGGTEKADNSVVTLDALKAFQNYVGETPTSNSLSAGIPISYRINYLRDNDPAALTLTTTYNQPSSTTKPHLQKVHVTFDTTDDDKDHDTVLTLTVEDSSGNNLGRYQQSGDDYFPNNTTAAKDVGLNVTLPVARTPSLRLHVRIDPKGNDTWKFNTHIDTYDSNGSLVASRTINSCWLSEGNRDNFFGLGNLLNQNEAVALRLTQVSSVSKGIRNIAIRPLGGLRWGQLGR